MLASARLRGESDAGGRSGTPWHSLQEEIQMFSERVLKGTLVVAILVMVLPATGAGQQRPIPAEPSDTARVIPLDPVVVSVTHLELLRSRVPNSVSVVTREQIEESGAASVLSAVSERVPGLFVTQRGVLGYGVGTGAAGRVSIRGAGANPNTQVLVMTDGRPQMMGMFGHPIADTHVSSGVERVEVVRGPASVLYGTSAMGGVVNLITRRQWREGPGVEAAVSHGTFGTQRQEFAFDYGFGGHSGVSLSGNRYRTDGHRPFASFEIDNAGLRGSSQLGSGLVVLMDGAVSDLKAYDPGTISAPRIDNWLDIRRATGGVSLENRNGRLAGATKLFMNYGRHEMHSGFYSRDHTVGMQVHQGLIFGGGRTLTLGADVKRFGGEAENRNTGPDWGSHQVGEQGVFGILHQPLPAGIVATGGVRLNNHSVYGSEVSPQLGVAVPVAQSTTVRASSARGFRSPTIRELYLFPAPNPDLQPERAWNNEVSILHRLGTLASLEVAVFRLEGSNLIQTSGSSPNLVLRNSGAFVHRGAEVALGLAPIRGASIDLSYGYLDSGEQTVAHPEHQLHASARYTVRGVTGNLGVQHVKGMYATDGGQLRLPAYTVVNGRLAIPLAGMATAYLSAENLLDEQYEMLAGYPMPGRVLSIGAFVRAR
jgi:outer membrane cobalamin receptor